MTSVKPSPKTDLDVKKFNSLLNLRHLFGYLSIGVFTAGLGWLVLILLVKLLNTNQTTAYFTSGHVGIFLNFYLNYKFNFKLNDQPWIRLMKKYFIHLSGLFVGHFFVLLTLSLFFNNFILTSFISYFVVFVYQYTLNKLYTYKLFV